MTLELQFGSVVPIPCRHCGQVCVRFSLAPGEHAITCPRCGNKTAVRVVGDPDRVRVFTHGIRTTVRPPTRA